jgi:hypothetical protein
MGVQAVLDLNRDKTARVERIYPANPQKARGYGK